MLQETTLIKEIPNYYTGPINLNFIGARDVFEKIIEGLFPTYTSDKKSILKKCLQDDWQFFQRIGIEWSVPIVITDCDNATLLCFLNFFGAQKTLNYFYNSHKLTGIDSAIQFNQLEALKFINPNELTAEHFNSALQTRNLAAIELLKDKNPKVFNHFQNQVKQNKNRLILQLFLPIYTKESKAILEYFFKSKKNLMSELGIREITAIFQTADISFVEEIIKYVVNITPSELVKIAYQAGNIKLAIYLETKLKVKFEDVFSSFLSRQVNGKKKSENKAQEQAAQIFSFLIKSGEEIRFDLALKLMREKMYKQWAVTGSLERYSIFHEALEYIIEFQQFGFLQKITHQLDQGARAGFFAYFVVVMPNVSQPRYFFNFLKLIMQLNELGIVPDIIGLMHSLIFYDLEPIGKEVLKEHPTFIFALLNYLQQNGLMYLTQQHLKEESFESILNDYLRDFGNDNGNSFKLISKEELTSNAVFQRIFGIVYSKISDNSFKLTAFPPIWYQELEDFFIDLVREGKVSWCSEFTCFASQPLLTKALIERALKSSYFGELKEALATYLNKDSAAPQVLSNIFSKLSLPDITKLILQFINEVDCENEKQLFKLICRVISEKFLSEKQARGYILGSVDGALLDILVEEGNKIEPDPGKCAIVIEKFNYFSACMLHFVSSISVECTMDYLTRAQPGFGKLLMKNGIHLILAKKDLDKSRSVFAFHQTIEMLMKNKKNGNNNNVSQTLQNLEGWDTTKIIENAGQSTHSSNDVLTPLTKTKKQESVVANCFDWMFCRRKDQNQADENDQISQDRTPILNHTRDHLE